MRKATRMWSLQASDIRVGGLFYCGRRKKTNVGVSLLAIAVCQPTSRLNDTPLSSERRPEQAHSYIEMCPHKI
jgi:hypothetical protein